ncbi:hypothetical protein EV129_12484 [Rhizobium azibense]|uniref:Uncharacterized protein n=1 Tax=Rhizobium azibense TaxID=1136135 RepID=A0A4R3RCM5_9HYPH|nr:hypothetical protein EV129_12484 [Rhizobium azibense]
MREENRIQNSKNSEQPRQPVARIWQAAAEPLNSDLDQIGPTAPQRALTAAALRNLIPSAEVAKKASRRSE